MIIAAQPLKQLRTPRDQYDILFILFSRSRLLIFALLQSWTSLLPSDHKLIYWLLICGRPPQSWRVTNSIDYRLSGNDSLVFSRRQCRSSSDLNPLRLSLSVVFIVRERIRYCFVCRFAVYDVVVLLFYIINHAKQPAVGIRGYQLSSSLLSLGDTTVHVST